MPIVNGMLYGAVAGFVWMAANIAYDAVFRRVVLAHQDQLNPRLLARPVLLLTMVAGWLVFLGGLFGALFGLLYPSLPGHGVMKGLFFGSVILFLPFARAPLEGRVLTSSPPSMHWFFLGEALVGLTAYGVTLGWLSA
ncbi:MAG TPA: hypothetical protein VNT01_15155 [Symbiobacteriaceae bacterium]|nr:hypothetical protein [Symbiobacteriaceae bacterium]